jgi:inosine/xanthosine triphosphatase
MKTIVVASKNPVKVRATLNGFKRMFRTDDFEAQTILVPSGVRDQPASNAETLAGALNRARAAQQIEPADYWVGIEGGIEDDGADMVAFAWVVVLSERMQGKGRTGTFFLPDTVARLVREGKELGEADDMVFGKTNSKQDNGAIGILTGDVIDRAQLYEQAVILALVPFKNKSLYPKHG